MRLLCDKLYANLPEVEIMPVFTYLDKSEFSAVAAELFGILTDNMAAIDPAGAFRHWYEAVGDGLRREQRQIILIRDAGNLIGFFQYYTNADTFMMEEIQLKSPYQGTGLFRALYGFVLSEIPADLTFVEAYTHTNNIKSIGILEKLGLSKIARTKDGNFYHFRGNFQDFIKWYNRGSTL